MGRPYGDDLRRKFLSAYDDGEGALEELSERFVVSLGWAKKISAQRNRTGQAERVAHRPGRKPHAGSAAQQQVRNWIAAKPDLTLAEIQLKLHNEAAVRLSLPQIWHLLRRLGLRLKKSRSMPGTGHRGQPQAAGGIHRAACLDPPERLIFLDESDVTTSMTRLRARCMGGRRIHEATPGGHWKIMTILGAMSMQGTIAAITIEEATDVDIFVAFIQQVLCLHSSRVTWW